MASFVPGSIKLVYFDARGVVENIRCMLTTAGIAFEDFRYPIGANFAKPEFDADQASGKFMSNLDRLPILIVDGEEIAQSKTIERYVAKLCGFMGKILFLFFFFPSFLFPSSHFISFHLIFFPYRGKRH